jgi:hypothetical protein
MRRFTYLGAVAILAVSLAGCGVRVQTGPASDEQQTERSEVTGKNQRIVWKNRFDAAPARQRLAFLKDYIDSTVANYFRFGQNIADEWRKGEEGRSEAISGDEMRRRIDATLTTQRPILEANDDVVDYAMGRIEEDRFFDRVTMEIVRRYRDGYFHVYDVVFLPAATRQEYLDRLYSEQSRLENLSREVGNDLGRY